MSMYLVEGTMPSTIFYFSQAILLPSVTLRSCSATDPGYLQAQIATNAIKPPLHATALMLPVVNQRNANEDDITITIAYLPLVGNTLFCVQLVKNGPKYLWL